MSVGGVSGRSAIAGRVGGGGGEEWSDSVVADGRLVPSDGGYRGEAAARSEAVAGGGRCVVDSACGESLGGTGRDVADQWLWSNGEYDVQLLPSHERWEWE